MKKFWLLAYANIRKTKSISVTFVIMFIIAALLLNTGLLVVLNYGSFYDELKEELNTSNAYFELSDKIYTEEVQSYLRHNEHVEQLQANESLALDAEIKSKGKEKMFSIKFSNMDESRDISRWKFVGDHYPAQEMSVYVPDIFKAVSGYQLNDKMEIKYKDRATKEEKTLSFTVKGYTEDVYFSSTDTGYINFYVPENTYQDLKNILCSQESLLHVVYTNLDDVKNISEVERGIRDILNMNSSSLLVADPTIHLFAIDIELIELSRCMMASMISAMMVLFSLIIVVVCLLVVRFRIVNSMEEDTMKIGSLKSVGYTSRQIIGSILLQYSLVTAIGSIIGCCLSYPLLPAVAAVFEQQSGLKWEQGFDGLITGASFIFLLLVVILISLIAARHIKKHNPINALRGESTARKYKKNHVPLEKAVGKLPIILAYKSVLQSLKQNIMIFVILTAVAFSGTFGVIMFYNTTVDTKAFEEVPGMEICNVIAMIHSQKNQEETVKFIESMDNVKQVQFLDQVKLRVDGMEVTANVMDTYEKKNTNLVYEGKYPIKENEITLAGVLAKRLGKKVGDTVNVSLGEKNEVFSVVGLSNGSQMGGLNLSVLTKDYEQLNPDFIHQALYIYLEKGTDAERFIKDLESSIDESILLATSNFDKQMEEGMASYQQIVAAMGIVMLIITLAVVTLVLYFVISSSVIRKRKELGIQKAIGFTTIQLMNQLSISFSVPVLIGVLSGVFLGAFYTNPLMSLAMSGIGIMKAGFTVNFYWVLAFGIFTILFSYVLSMLITWRIRKISAYALVTE